VRGTRANPRIKRHGRLQNLRPNGCRCESDMRDETGQSDFGENLPTDLQIFRHLAEMKNKIGRRNAFGKNTLEPLSLRVLDSLVAEGHSELAAGPEHSAAAHHEPPRSQQLFIVKGHFFHRFSTGSAVMRVRLRCRPKRSQKHRNNLPQGLRFFESCP